MDDGPRDWHEAVDLLAMAAEEGIETIVATPHVLRGRWRNTSRATLAGLVDTLREKTNDTPHVVLGSEYFFAHDMADVVAAGDQVIPLAGSKYVLVEFASQAVPPLVEQPFYRLQLAGFTAVIAHPERNLVFQSKPELLLTLVRGGARTQITAGSFTGLFGPEAQRAAESWLAAGLVHFVASDAHNTKRRPPHVREAIARVRELSGDDVTEALIRGNPQAVLDGRMLPYEPEPRLPFTSSGLMSKIKRLWGHRE